LHKVSYVIKRHGGVVRYLAGSASDDAFFCGWFLTAELVVRG